MRNIYYSMIVIGYTIATVTLSGLVFQWVAIKLQAFNDLSTQVQLQQRQLKALDNLIVH